MSLVYKTKLFRDKEKRFQECPNVNAVWVSKCSCGQKFIQQATCKKEICEVCGQNGSALHLQRVKRWLPKVLKLWLDNGRVGYLVVTIPKSECYRFKDKEMLRKFRRYVIRKLKRMGIKGKCRYHWVGDIGSRFHPHLNILHNKGFIEKEDLRKFKKEVAEWLGVKVIVAKNKYKTSLRYVVETTCYVCRPTLNLLKDKNERFGISRLVEGGRKGWNSLKNDVEFGKLEEIKFDEDEDGEVVDMFQNTKNEKMEILIEQTKKMATDEAIMFWLMLNRCPFCRKKLKWRYCKKDYLDYFWIGEDEQICDLKFGFGLISKG